jgi:hypothetical protein
MSVIATWGAVTGTIGLALAGRREILQSRPRLSLGHGVHVKLSRDEPVALEGLWAVVRLVNAGARAVTVEHAGLLLGEGRRVEVSPFGPVTLEPYGPSTKLYLPVGALLAVGFDALRDPVQAWAKTSDGREWQGDNHLILSTHPPGIHVGPFYDGVGRLREAFRESPPAEIGRAVFGVHADTIEDEVGHA